MKSLVVFFVTALILLKPLWPLAEYIANYDYIVNVLCENRAQPQLKCDGKCYLSKLWAEENSNDRGNPFKENRAHMDLSQLFFFDTPAKKLLLTFRGQDTIAQIGYFEKLVSQPYLQDLVDPPEYL